MKKYIIFDLDGTLVDSESGNFPLQYEYLKTQIPDLEYDYFMYYITQTAGSPLVDQLRVLCKNTFDEDHLQRITDEMYDVITNNSDNNHFFTGVTDMVHQLNPDYTLFLCTANSDKFAQKKLSDGGISACFNRIMGSSIILKGPEHIKIFKELTGDEDFEKNTIYIGDGNTDRDIAAMHNIDFIKVGKAGIDTYEVEKTTDALEIIKSL